MDQAISMIVGGVVLAVSFLMDHPGFAAILMGIFVVGRIVDSERDMFVEQLRRELQDLKGHIDTRLDCVERSLRDLPNSLP